MNRFLNDEDDGAAWESLMTPYTKTAEELIEELHEILSVLNRRLEVKMIPGLDIPKQLSLALLSYQEWVDSGKPVQVRLEPWRRPTIHVKAVDQRGQVYLIESEPCQPQSQPLEDPK